MAKSKWPGCERTILYESVCHKFDVEDREHQPDWIQDIRREGLPCGFLWHVEHHTDDIIYCLDCARKYGFVW